MDSKEMLNSVLETAQKGQTHIKSALSVPMRSILRCNLENQLREFDSIELEAYRIACSRGWELEEMEPGAKILSNMISRLFLLHGNTESKLAAMMIHSSTRGMITALRNSHQLAGSDPLVTGLSQKLLDCQTAAIKNLQMFL